METLTETLACPKCGSTGEHRIELRDKGVHYANAWCADCGKHWFPPKPESDPTKYRRPNQHRDLVAAFSQGFCEMCLRCEPELKKGQTFHAHHVVEYKDGGSPKRENIWIICTACHQMIHWIRTYHGTLDGAVKLRNDATGMTLFETKDD